MSAAVPAGPAPLPESIRMIVARPQTPAPDLPTGPPRLRAPSAAGPFPNR